MIAQQHSYNFTGGQWAMGRMPIMPFGLGFAWRICTYTYRTATRYPMLRCFPGVFRAEGGLDPGCQVQYNPRSTAPSTGIPALACIACSSGCVSSTPYSDVYTKVASQNRNSISFFYGATYPVRLATDNEIDHTLLLAKRVQLRQVIHS